MAGIRWSDEATATEAARAATAADDRGSFTVEQSALRQWGGIAFALVGGLVFLGLAALSASMGPVAIVGFGFFGLLGLASAIGALARGTDSRLLVVGPDGLWLPGMGFLAWAEIAEVRLENLRGLANSDTGATRSYRRIGVLPRDPDRKPDVATRGAWLLADGYFRLVRRMAPGVRIGGDDLAPFALNEMETSAADFDEALAVVRRYVEVVDSAARRARERAPRWAAHDAGASVGTAAPAADLHAIDAHLADGPPTVGAGAVAPAFVPIASARPPSATFLAARPTPASIVRLVLTLAPPLAFLFTAWDLGALRNVSPLAILLIGAVLLIPFVRAGIPEARRLARQLRAPGPPTVVLRVGPDGIWLPGTATLPWVDVEVIRTETCGYLPNNGEARIPRWRLVVVPAARSGRSGEFGVLSDALDVPFDDVLDLVRYYHPVDDR
ncbi:MAG TPA: hypothetical protein VFP19_10125 [Candidatus Limnocylindrales bacterium]|nr:hypothetical protein [Candidatus Limnocylindrales bacterium]